MSSITSSVSELAPGFSGRLLLPADVAYDEARKVHNGMIDKRPALIAQCQGAADIVDAVKLARTLNLEVAVRGGGHNVAGKGTIDGGLLIDLSRMKGIHVDPAARRVRAEGGVIWKELDRETQFHGLATTGGVVSTTGIAGLTLGGGLGYLMPKYGLALDNLRSADMVLADGRLVRTSASQEPDLFWAIRGGGGNFGVAASLEYELHPVGPIITGGMVAHPAANARNVLRFFRDFAATVPDDVMVVAALVTAPDGSGAKIAAIAAGHCGSLPDGEAALRPLKAYGPPVMDALGPIPYTALNSMMDGAYPKGSLNYWKSQLLSSLSDDCIDTIADRFDASDSPAAQIVIEHFHGSSSRVGPTETACASLRREGFNLLIASVWSDPRENDRHITWTRDSYAAMRPFLGTARYVNYLGEDEEGDPAALAYGPNYARLRQLKTKYDPENFFHVNVNIKPL